MQSQSNNAAAEQQRTEERAQREISQDNRTQRVEAALTALEDASAASNQQSMARFRLEERSKALEREAARTFGGQPDALIEAEARALQAEADELQRSEARQQSNRKTQLDSAMSRLRSELQSTPIQLNQPLGARAALARSGHFPGLAAVRRRYI